MTNSIRTLLAASLMTCGTLPGIAWGGRAKDRRAELGNESHARSFYRGTWQCERDL
jgi:hypothetical protein